MMTERGMVAPAAGGSVLARFDTILATAVPELTGRARGVAFDADTGRLDVVPEAPACGTKLRWSAPKLIAAANERVPNADVRALRVLAPAPLKASPGPASADPAPQLAAPVVPVERRGVPRARRRPGRCAGPDRAGPHPAAPPGRSDRGRLRRARAERAGATVFSTPHPRQAAGEVA
ncbi:hypothetical protein [Streptomyces jumonjinensis]|uniref:hypothetical protein n=1 Tax=Streptomyces jumonjinensis TaxID=1945 RepID=UPI001E5DC9DA|nr:hypothetical protein [Streptomyces jumonjinensis]